MTQRMNLADRAAGPGKAERGIIAGYKDAHELQLMRGVKDLFDPAGLMNPGKVLPDA